MRNGFTGTFDGQGYTISNLYMNHTVAYAGIFDFATNATIKNVTFIDPVVIGQQYTAVVVGEAVNTTLSDVHVVNGDLNGWGAMGSLIAMDRSTNISNCSASGTIRGRDDLGGLVGYAYPNGYDYAGIITDSHADVEILAQSYNAGGLVGTGSINILRCYATGNVSTDGSFGGGQSIGGLVGSNEGSINDSYASGNVHATATMAGGIAGYNTGAIYNSYASGNVSGLNTVGGLAGFTRGSIVGCHASGTVSGSGNAVGGLIGEMVESATIIDCYAEGDVQGANKTGGLVGTADFANPGGLNILRSHASGDVSGSNNVGGLVGRSENAGELSGSYATGNVTGPSSYTSPAELGNSIGGLVGYSGFRLIANCTASGGATGQENVGGLLGYNAEGRVTNSSASGSVYGYDLGEKIGGLIGQNSKGLIESSASSGDVRGWRRSGGFIGVNYGGTILDCHSAGSLVGGDYTLGGLIGNTSFSYVARCYATGNVTVLSVYGANQVGGLIGYCGDSLVEDSYSTGDVHGRSNVGGLVGYMSYSNINRSYSISRLFGENSYEPNNIGAIGGLVGGYYAPYERGYGIHLSFAAGPVGGPGGGLVGDAVNLAITSSHWDMCRAGKDRCVGNLCNAEVPGCIPENNGSSPNPGYFYNNNEPMAGWGPEWGSACSGSGYPVLASQGADACASRGSEACAINPLGGKLNVHYSGGNLNIRKDDMFNVTANISCASGICGNVSVTLDPKQASGAITSILDYYPYVYAIYSPALAPFSSGSLSNKYVAIKSGAKSGMCYRIVSNWPGAASLSLDVYPGLAVGDQFEVWDTLAECQNAFVHYISSVRMSYEPPGIWQNLSCVANVTPDVVDVKFRITDPYFVRQVDMVSGAKDGGLWYSPTVLAHEMGAWNCTVFAYDQAGGSQNASISFTPGHKGAVPMGQGSPFYTIDQNPVDQNAAACLAHMEAGDSCVLNWRVNATGEYGVWEFFAIAEAGACVPDAESEHFFVKIGNRTTKGVVSTEAGATPFYTVDPNPAIWKDTGCLKSMGDGDTCNVGWRVKATGDIGTVWDFFTVADSSSVAVPSAESGHFNVTITTSQRYDYHPDNDSDTFGDWDPAKMITVPSPTPPEGYVIDNTDSNDNDYYINPLADEICDGMDNNCDDGSSWWKAPGQQVPNWDANPQTGIDNRDTDNNSKSDCIMEDTKQRSIEILKAMALRPYYKASKCVYSMCVKAPVSGETVCKSGIDLWKPTTMFRDSKNRTVMIETSCNKCLYENQTINGWKITSLEADAKMDRKCDEIKGIKPSCILEICVNSSATNQTICKKGINVTHPTTTFTDSLGNTAVFKTSCSECIEVNDSDAVFTITKITDNGKLTQKCKVLSSEQKKDQKRIQKAIRYITKSLGNRIDGGDRKIVWLDDNHVQCKYGHKMFSNERKAVKELEKIKDPVYREQTDKVIQILVGIDRRIANISITEAPSRNVSQKDIEHALKHFNKGEAETKASKKIQEYRKAWKHVNKHCVKGARLSCMEELIFLGPDGEEYELIGDDISPTDTVVGDEEDGPWIKVKTSCSECLYIGQTLTDKNKLNWTVTDLIEYSNKLGTMANKCRKP